MAKQVAEISKSVKKHKDSLAKQKKDFKGDGKVDVLNQMMTVEDKFDSLDVVAKALHDVRTKYLDNVKNIEQSDKDVAKLLKDIEVVKANKIKMEKEQDGLRKGIKDNSKSYNDALTVVKTMANVAKDLITRNKLTDKAKDTKTGDFAAVMADVKDINDITALPT